MTRCCSLRIVPAAEEAAENLADGLLPGGDGPAVAVVPGAFHGR